MNDPTLSANTDTSVNRVRMRSAANDAGMQNTPITSGRLAAAGPRKNSSSRIATIGRATISARCRSATARSCATRCAGSGPPIRTGALALRSIGSMRLRASCCSRSPARSSTSTSARVLSADSRFSMPGSSGVSTRVVIGSARTSVSTGSRISDR